MFHRDYIQGMTDREAKNYLLEVLEASLNAKQDEFARIKDFLPTLAPRGALLMAMLWKAQGRILTYGYLAQQIEVIRGFYLNSQGIASHIKRMRPVIAESGFPLEIVTHSGVGYALKVTDPNWVAPWEDQHAACP